MLSNLVSSSDRRVSMLIADIKVLDTQEVHSYRLQHQNEQITLVDWLNQRDLYFKSYLTNTVVR